MEVDANRAPQLIEIYPLTIGTRDVLHELLGEPSCTERQLSTNDVLTNLNQFESNGLT